jgi:hypothetical protein
MKLPPFWLFKLLFNFSRLCRWSSLLLSKMGLLMALMGLVLLAFYPQASDLTTYGVYLSLSSLVPTFLHYLVYQYFKRF